MSNTNRPSTHKGQMHLVMRLNRWDKIEALTPFPVPVAPIGKSIGFLLVYDDLDALNSDYPDSPFIGIERDLSPQLRKASSASTLAERKKSIVPSSLEAWMDENDKEIVGRPEK